MRTIRATTNHATGTVDVMKNVQKNVWGETGGLTSAAAIEKNNKYARGFAFRPIILEQYGAMGKGTKDQISLLASRISRSTGMPLPVVKRYWMQRLSVVLQDWNAWTIQTRLGIVSEHPMNGGTGRGRMRGGVEEDRYDDRVWGVQGGGDGAFPGD